MPSTSPKAAYELRLGERRVTVAALEGRSRRIADLRLACFLGIAVVAYLAIGPGLFTPWLIALPVAAFLALVLVHDRALTAQKRAQRAVQYYERGVARIDDRWSGSGETGE